MMTRVKHTLPIVKLNLKLQCESRVDAISVMRIYQLKGTRTITGAGADNAAKPLDERNKRVIVDKAKNLDVVMPMYKLTEYTNNHSKTLGKYYTKFQIIPIQDNKNRKKSPIGGNTKDVEIAMSLKYLRNFLGTLEMLLINYKIDLILAWSADYVISSATGAIIFSITETKRHGPVITLSTWNSGKLVQQLKTGFKRNISWNNYQSKVTRQA